MCDVKKVRMGCGKPKAMQAKRLGDGRSINLKDEYEVVRPGKPNEVNKSPWVYKVSKRAREAQGKQMGQGCPRENKKDTGAHR